MSSAKCLTGLVVHVDPVTASCTANTRFEDFLDSTQAGVVVEEGACDNKMRRELDPYMQPLTPG
jgi:hypothetical protein